MHHVHQTVLADRSPDSWRRSLDAAVLDYCAKHDVLPQDAVDAVADFLRDKPVIPQRLAASELRHRTKNEMQFLISSMRHRRLDRASDEKGSCNACIGQVVALAQMNDALDIEEIHQQIDISDHCKSLANAAREAFSIEEDIRIKVEVKPLLVAPDVARIVLLILNEALTNAIKHAFGDSGGTVYIKLVRRSASEAELLIADNGCAAKPSGVGGSGGSLIDALASQIDGRIQRVRTGTGFRLSCTFPLH